ncbi:MAG: M28 family metallopeptidase [Bacillota bacterium]
MDRIRCARRTAGRLIFLLLIILSLTAFAVSCAPRPEFNIAADDIPALSLHPDVDATANERVTSDLAFLTSEFCNGRQVGTSGATRSAQYVVDEFERIGLEPGYRNSYVQGFETKYRDQVTGSVRVLGANGEVAAHFDSPQDLGVGYYSSPGSNVVKGTLTALPSTDEGWRDLKRGSVIVAKNHQDDSSSILNPASRYKAAAVLLSVPSIAKGPVGMGATRMSGVMPVFLITEDCYNQLQEHIGKQVELQIDAESGQTVAGFNVVGILGNPNSEPTVIICAHRDTLGTGEGGYVPIQGGTDNASGTAGLLEIARILEARPEWKWATVFVSFDGEEIGLTGSKYFAASYPFNESNLKLVVNLDCVAVTGCSEVEIYKTSKSDLALSVAEAIVEQLRAVSLEGIATEESYASDQRSFEAEGFATLAIHSPVTAMRPHLHSPRDTIETVDASVLAALAQVVAEGLISTLGSGE